MDDNEQDELDYQDDHLIDLPEEVFIVNDNPRKASFTTLSGVRVLPGELVLLHPEEANLLINAGLASYVADDSDE